MACKRKWLCCNEDRRRSRSCEDVCQVQCILFAARSVRFPRCAGGSQCCWSRAQATGHHCSEASIVQHRSRVALTAQRGDCTTHSLGLRVLSLFGRRADALASVQAVRTLARPLHDNARTARIGRRLNAVSKVQGSKRPKAGDTDSLQCTACPGSSVLCFKLAVHCG